MVSADQYHKFLAWQGMELYPGEQGDTTYTPYQEHNNGNRGGTSPDGPQSPPEHPQHLVSPDPPCLHNTSFTCYTVNASASAVGELNKALKVFSPPAQEKDSTRENEKNRGKFKFTIFCSYRQKRSYAGIKNFLCKWGRRPEPTFINRPPRKFGCRTRPQIRSAAFGRPPLQFVCACDYGSRLAACAASLL